MSDFANVLEQVRQAAAQHMSPGTETGVLLVGLGLLIVGIIISSLGAKFARVGITGLFVALGAYVGYRFGVSGGFQPAICAAVAGTMVGIISFVTFRLWIGIATGVVLASLSLGGFGYERVLPHVREFSPYPHQTSAGQTASHYVVPSPAEQQAYLQRDTEQYFRDLRTFVADRDGQVERDGRLLGAAAFLAGTLLGVLAVRWMSILSTSIVGTVLVTTASLMLLAQLLPGAYQALAKTPTAAGIAMGAFLVSSLIVQFMVTRKAASVEK